MIRTSLCVGVALLLQLVNVAADLTDGVMLFESDCNDREWLNKENGGVRSFGRRL